MKNYYARRCFGIVMLLSFLSPKSAFAQSLVTFNNVTSALSKIREDYGKRIGFEMADADTTAVMVDLSKRDVNSPLDSLVAQKPVYTWSLEDGVYDVYPRSQTDALLDLTIANFILSNATLEDAQDALFSLPEVRNWLSRHGATRSTAQSGSRFIEPSAPQPEAQRVSMNLTNVQLRTILNQVIIGFNRTQWLIGHVIRREYGKDVSYISIEL